jgi:hypothetical protein
MRKFLAAAICAALLAGAPASAQTPATAPAKGGISIGSLTCNVAAGLAEVDLKAAE